MGSAVHQLLQRFVAHAQEPEETPIPDLEPTFTPDPIPEPPADAAPTEQYLPQ
jgi:hypothetical protein